MKFVGLLVVMMSIVPPQINLDVYEAICDQRFIEEEELVRVKLSCYVATGNKTADGSVPYEGVISCNKSHLGQDAIMYDENFIPVARFQCRDIGGHKLLREGKAIDVFRDSLERCYSFKAQYPEFVYIKWIDRSYEGEAPVPEYIKNLKVDTD